MGEVSMKYTTLRPGDIVAVKAEVFVTKPGNFLESTFLGVKFKNGDRLGLESVEVVETLSRDFKVGDRVRFVASAVIVSWTVRAVGGNPAQLWLQQDGSWPLVTALASDVSREGED